MRRQLSGSWYLGAIGASAIRFDPSYDLWLWPEVGAWCFRYAKGTGTGGISAVVVNHLAHSASLDEL
jgi:hypothetical protein